MRTRPRVLREDIRHFGILRPSLSHLSLLFFWAALPSLLLAQSATGPPGAAPSSKAASDPLNEPVNIESRKPAQPEAKTDSRQVDIRVNRTLVLINVTVTDPLNRFVTGLEKEHFRLFEDKVEQEITHFSSEDAPISIGLVFDTSGSMGSKMQESRQAAAEFFKAANLPMNSSSCNLTIVPSPIVSYRASAKAPSEHCRVPVKIADLKLWAVI